MAFPSAGLSCSFGGTSLSQPLGMSVSGYACQVVDCGVNSNGLKVYESGNIDLGTVSIESLSAEIDTSLMSSIGTLVIRFGSYTQNGGGWNGNGQVNVYNGNAVFQGFDETLALGEPVKFTYTFKLSADPAA